MLFCLYFLNYFMFNKMQLQLPKNFRSVVFASQHLILVDTSKVSLVISLYKLADSHNADSRSWYGQKSNMPKAVNVVFI